MPFHQQQEIGCAAADLQILPAPRSRGRNTRPSPQLSAIHPIAVIAEDNRPHDASAVFRPHMELFTQRDERDFQILDDGIGLILRIECVLMQILNRMFRAVVEFPPAT